MKKQKLLATVLVAGFLYFLGTTLYSQTTYDESKCNCGGESCLTAEGCANCGAAAVNGKSGNCGSDCSCAQCSGSCSEAGTCMNMKAEGHTGSMQSGTCGAAANCCADKTGSAGSQLNCCNKVK